MAPNKSSKKQKETYPENTEVARSVAKATGKGLMSIAEVRMVLYVLPVAITLALFVFFNTHGYSWQYVFGIPVVFAAIMFTIVRLLVLRK